MALKILWSNKAVSDLDSILEYLETNWSEKEIKNFIKKLEKRLELISERPLLYPETTSRKNVRRSVLIPQLTIYYKLNLDSIVLLSIFDNRQSTNKLKKF